MFNAAAPAYQMSLDISGYNHTLKFDPEARKPGKQCRNRKRKISWFNPPYSMNAKTNHGARFLKLIDTYFPL